MRCKLVLLVCCLTVLLQALQCVVAAGKDCDKKFKPQRLCPTNHSDLRAFNTISEQHCALVCSNNAHCSLFHFNETSSKCVQGNSTCQGLALWAEGDCTSYRDEANDMNEVNTCKMAGNLKLRMLYRFSSHGLVNVADPGKLTLTSHGVTVNHEGAHFSGSRSSYLHTATPTFHNEVGLGNTYSWFATAKMIMNASAIQSEFVKCDGSDNADYLWLDSGQVQAAAFDSQKSGHYVIATGDVYKATAEEQLFSVGAAYDGQSFTTGYFNKSKIRDFIAPNNPNTNMLQANFTDCLRLGYDASADHYCLKGTMKCFAFSSRTLLVDEFKQLEDWCLLAV